MRGAKVTALAICLVATPAVAAISQVEFRGFGRVTTGRVGPDPGFPQPVPPPVGTPVRIDGTLVFGDAALPDGFTGIFVFDVDALFDGRQGFRWVVAGGGSAASTFDSFASAFGDASFTGGRLTGLALYVDYDGDDHSLFRGGWRTSYSFQDVDWSGTWALAVPEPASWALLVTGFGLVGAALRRRARIAA